MENTLKVIEIIDNPDGSANIIFEVTNEFKKEFKEMFGLKRFTQKAFQKFVLNALDNMIAKHDTHNPTKKH
jgi:hypothetical protein